VNDYSAIIFTHLPAPTRVSVQLQDWTGPSYQPVDADNPSYWGSAVPSDAQFNNQKPIRIRFAMEQRPGIQWNNHQKDAEVRIFRRAHMRVNVADQFILFKGAPFAGSSTEDRRIVSRKFTNDDHTISIDDKHFRDGFTFKSVSGGIGDEWIFRPVDFKKDFRGVPDEPIQFGDYLQLEELPSWTSGNTIAGERSRFQIAFMNYLFYLSVHSQDRSGRYVGCINKSFVDRSKICNNSAGHWVSPGGGARDPCPWPDDYERQFKKTYWVRQWSDEQIAPGLSWVTDQAARWSMAQGSIGYKLLRHKWQEHTPFSSTGYSGLSGLELDTYSHWHAVNNAYGGTPPNADLPVAFANMNRQITNLGSWLWEGTGNSEWRPCITRDFHGYYVLPGMVDIVFNQQTFLFLPGSPFGANGPNVPGWWAGGWSPGSTGVNWRSTWFYGVTDKHGHNLDSNTGHDSAKSKVWQSVAYFRGSQIPTGLSTPPPASATRFWNAVSVLMDHEPTETINTHAANYQRQDEWIRYESCRGVWSRGVRPAETPTRISSAGPYYQNVGRYERIYTRGSITPRLKDHTVDKWVQHTGGASGDGIPLHRADVYDWFRMAFRYEYIWESAQWFPTRIYGREKGVGYNYRKARLFAPTHVFPIYYDDGAWAGWKDDGSAGGFLALDPWLQSTSPSLFFPTFRKPATGIFDSNYMHLLVGPVLQQADMYFHLVLVNERREIPY
jgi:hypothetical protein